MPLTYHSLCLLPNQHYDLRFDDAQYLIALALEDNAFFGIDSPEAFWDLQIPDGEDSLILKWDDSVKACQSSVMPL
jgi:hypothetical protein